MKLNEIVANSCRVCLKRTPKLRSLYNPLDEGEEPPNEMLRLIAGIELEEPDVYETLPKFICKNCELSLSMAFQFRDKVLRTNQILQTLRKQLWPAEDAQEKTNKATSTDVKVELEDWANNQSNEEVNVNEDYLQDNRELKVEVLELSFSDIEEIDLEDDQVEVELNEDEESNEGSKPEYLEETDFYNDVEAPSTHTSEPMSPEIQQHNSPQSDIYNYDNEVDFESDNGSVNDVLIDEETAEIAKKKPVGAGVGTNPSCQVSHNNVMPADVQGQRRSTKKANNNKGKQRKKLISSKEGSTLAETENVKSKSNAICDICGNVFAKRGRMMEHRRRHDKELRFACELCDKRFELREKLRKHMFLHTGGKPYKCSFCSRTFFYESVKRAHEVVHSGVKPYVCDECNKAFAYAHALSKHKLIHADIKLYHCEYCSKDFRLQHHMKQHIETKLHQNAVRVAQMSLAGRELVDDSSGMEAPTSTSNT